MSPVLLHAGYIQIGTPFFPNYDPICFDTHTSQREPPPVQLDHELILQFGKIRMVSEIARSLVHLLGRLIHGGEMPDRIG